MYIYFFIFLSLSLSLLSLSLIRILFQMGGEHPDWLPVDWKVSVKIRSSGRKDKVILLNIALIWKFFTSFISFPAFFLILFLTDFYWIINHSILVVEIRILYVCAFVRARICLRGWKIFECIFFVLLYHLN